MESKVIELEFDKLSTSLAGNPYGESVFEDQVKNKIDYNTRTEIVFPDQIEDIATSFIQGFFREIIEKIGIAGFEEKIIVKAKDESLVRKITDNIY